MSSLDELAEQIYWRAYQRSHASERSRGTVSAQPWARPAHRPRAAAAPL